MIYTDNDTLKITQKNIIRHKDFQSLMPRYLIPNNPHSPLNLHTSSFENDSFVVDWQLYKEGNSGVDKLLY